MPNLFDEQRNYGVLDTVKTCIYWKDLNGKYLGCNKYMMEILDLTGCKDIVGKTDFELLIFDDATQCQKNDHVAIEQGFYEGEESIILANGKRVSYWSTKHRFHDSEGKVIGIAGNSFDIGNYKIRMELEKQQAVLSEKLQVDQIIDVVNASIYWKNLHGVMLGCNQYVLDLFGASQRQEVIGKNEYDLMSEEEAIRITKIDQSVVENGYYGGEEIFTSPSGEKKTYFTVKNRLLDRENNVIGIVGTSLEITAQKEAEQLRAENEKQKVLAQEQEKFRQNVNKVVHDIRSPLTTLLILAQVCTGIPEKERIALREAATRIGDISNNLLSNYRKNDIAQTPETEEREPILISPVLQQILTEKKYQYQQLGVKFDHQFSRAGEFSWINVQRSALTRMLSNIINNAVDAFDQKQGNIVLHLDADEKEVRIEIEDNGKGMSPALVQKILDKIAVTEGKEDGHGLGLQQVRDTLQDNEGIWEIDSEVDIGTKIKLTFARTQALGWIAESVELNDNDTVVILDDDSSIHMAWDFRFEKILKLHPGLKVKHFEIGRETIEFINALGPDKKENSFLLADYELLNQDLNGLQVIDLVQMKRAILVTSHYANKRVQQSAFKTGTKILPKQLASSVPIHINKSVSRSDLKDIDVIFVDDDEPVLASFKFLAFRHKVDAYSDPKLFLNNIDQYRKDTKIVLDQNFDNYHRKGTEIAEQLHALGFTRLYLLSGQSLLAVHVPHYLKALHKTDVGALQDVLDE